MSQINRALKDKAMDNIDHALGRPFDPMGETYRNHFATSGARADTMAASPFWKEHRPISGDLRSFSVTLEGRAALAAHLRTIKDPWRAFTVQFDQYARTVFAVSHSKARYSYFLDLLDVMPDMTFTDFCRRSSVRVAA